MASPFVPVPVPMDRALSGGSSKLRRPQRASSLGSVSSFTTGQDHGRGCGGLGTQHQSRCVDRGSRSRTPPPPQSPVTRARVNGTLEPSMEYSSCPRSISDPAGSQQSEERPITPTVLGYEVMEERAKFTVFKVLVRKTPDESWVVFRRYTDFSRLNDKLKEMFPGFRLSLPPKRWFKDNYDTDFLEDRQLGLQAFLQNLVAHKDIASCLAVREFLCLDDPPGPFDSLEESRAFCETLEESNYRLQKELLEKQKEIASLKRRLEEREQAILLLEKHINPSGECVSPASVCVCPSPSGECVSPASVCDLSAQGSESSTDADVESSAAEADQDVPEDTGGRCAVQPVRSSACWCGPSLSSSPPLIQVTPLYHQKLDQ
ncbi:sorting nexin-16 isoform X3 [Sander vitreus]